MKEALNQKVQEKKPLLKFKNTKKYMCLERIWRKSFRQRTLISISMVDFKIKNAFSGDNLMSMLLKPSYTTQDSEKVEDGEPDHQQSTITKMLNAATIKPPPPPV